ncbi:MAG: NAD-dependent malic enzyme, partial [Actinomyces graevenitzii]|nr:NAD-dependent malic enzyme [Actinomyces graevenitzii]
MAQPSPSYTVALRLQVPRSQASVAQLVDTAASTGAIVTGVDVDDPSGEKVVIDLTMDLRDSNHRLEVIDLLKNLPGVEVETVGDSTFLAHIGGKIEIAARTPIRN